MSCKHDLAKIYGIKGYPECSGHGSCVQGLCVCDAGWTGYSDLELEYGFDCDISILSVKVWASVDIVLAAVATLLILYCCWKEDILSRKNIYRTKTKVFISYFAANLFGCIYLPFKIIDPERNIVGVLPVLSVCLIVIAVSFSFGISSFFILFLNFLKGYSRYFDLEASRALYHSMSTLSLIARTLPFVYFVLLCSALIPLHLLPSSNSDKFNILFSVAFLIIYSFFGFLVLKIFTTFLREIKKFLDRVADIEQQSEANEIQKDEAVVNLFKKMELAKMAVQPSQYGGLFMNLVFVSWSILRRKQVYLLLFEFSLASVSGIGIVLSLTASNRGMASQSNKSSLSEGTTLFSRKTTVIKVAPHNVRVDSKVFPVK